MEEIEVNLAGEAMCVGIGEDEIFKEIEEDIIISSDYWNNFPESHYGEDTYIYEGIEDPIELKKNKLYDIFEDLSLINKLLLLEKELDNNIKKEVYSQMTEEELTERIQKQLNK